MFDKLLKEMVKVQEDGTWLASPQPSVTPTNIDMNVKEDDKSSEELQAEYKKDTEGKERLPYDEWVKKWRMQDKSGNIKK
jgi:hypothetical protein